MKLFKTKCHGFWFWYSTITTIIGVALIWFGDIQIALWLQAQFLISAAVRIITWIEENESLSPIVPNTQNQQFNVEVEYGHAHGDARAEMKISTDKGSDAN